jgi:hypothetical protein
MKTIELDNIEDIGAIIPMKTGVRWTNQVGGNSCLHPELEGVYIPIIKFDETANDPLYNVWDMDYDAKIVGKFLLTFGISSVFEPITNFPEKLQEAWIWVQVRSDCDCSGIQIGFYPFAGMPCVITYRNSD